MKTPTRSDLVKRYRRQGYLKCRNEMLRLVGERIKFYKDMYAKRTDQADAQMSLGRVFAAEDILSDMARRK